MLSRLVLGVFLFVLEMLIGCAQKQHSAFRTLSFSMMSHAYGALGRIKLDQVSNTAFPADVS